MFMFAPAPEIAPAAAEKTPWTVAGSLIASMGNTATSSETAASASALHRASPPATRERRWAASCARRGRRAEREAAATARTARAPPARRRGSSPAVPHGGRGGTCFSGGNIRSREGTFYACSWMTRPLHSDPFQRGLLRCSVGGH